MKNALILSAALVGAAVSQSAYAAVTVSGTTSVSGYNGNENNGLKVSTQNGSFGPQVLNADNVLGGAGVFDDYFYFTAFKIKANESIGLGDGDGAPGEAITIDFSFSNPLNVNDTPIVGTTMGVWTWGGVVGQLTWTNGFDSPGSLDINNPTAKFTYGNGGEFWVWLENTTFERSSWTDVSAKIWVKSESRPPVVPEPGTWAMLIAGMGAVGFAMRRRKVAVSFA